MLPYQNGDFEEWDLWKDGEYKLCLSILLDHYIKQLNFKKRMDLDNRSDKWRKLNWETNKGECSLDN